jgi:hypothetical protein
MHSHLRLSLPGTLLLAALSACSRDKTCPAGFSEEVPVANNAGAAGTGPTSSSGDGQRAISEADIVAMGTSRLYAMTLSGNLAIVDVSTPGKLNLVGLTTLPGVPFEMYERGDVLVAMSNGAINSSGATVTTTPDSVAPTTPDPNASAVVLALDVHDPSNVTTLATFKVPGAIADSRIVGDVLYLATYENGTCYSCGQLSRTLVTTFNVANPAAMAQVDQAIFTSNAPATYNAAWGMAWKRSIVATTTRLYLGGQAYVDPQNPQQLDEGIVDVLDISDPAGHLGKGAHFTIAGAILNRWQLDENQGVLRVISQHGAGFTGNGTAAPEVTTFTIQSTSSFVPLGHTTLALPSQEGLRTVQFDGIRAYAITFNQTDPLFTIDLSDPANPAQRGQLSMPGWMFYLQPHGNRVIGLGVDRTNPQGSLNVSLFDVTDLSSPQMLARVPFAAQGVDEDYAILNYELPEDQDRIQKAFAVYDDGFVAVPFSTTGTVGSTTCQNPASGVQLLQWANDTLVKHALLPVAGNPRRALELTGQMLAVSDSNVASFSLATPDVATQTAAVTIGTCVARTTPQGAGGLPGADMPGDAIMGGSSGCN